MRSITGKIVTNFNTQRFGGVTVNTTDMQAFYKQRWEQSSKFRSLQLVVRVCQLAVRMCQLAVRGCQFSDSSLWDSTLEKFLSNLNSHHATIKFTASWSTEEIIFLDTRVYLNNQQHIKTDLHVKPTDTHQYLHNKSCHPRHCKTAIPYGQALRLRRICSEEENLQKRTNKLMRHLSNRGYPKELLRVEI